MSAATDCLRPIRDVHTRELLPHYGLHRREGKIKWIAFGVALSLHVALLMVSLPVREVRFEPKVGDPIVVTHLPLRPPPIETRRSAEPTESPLEPRPFLTVPSPRVSDPVQDRRPPAVVLSATTPVDFILDSIEAPPAWGPLVPDGVRVTMPVRIGDSYVKPQYPALARAARAGARVILQAVILKDGSVGEIMVLSSTRPNLGFEQAAIEAVEQWRYLPAKQDERAVDVYFTVVVEFSLQ